MESLLERYPQQISGVISCFDRVVITGSHPDICYSDGMAAHLSTRGIRLFDFTGWAEPLRDQLRSNAEALAAQEGVEIQYINNKNIRKEECVKQILAKRGDHPGLVHIISALEGCKTFQPWYDKEKQLAFLKMRQGQCLHYYFYFMDEELGLCYLRVPTWAPFRLQFYFNGHNWLARQLEKGNVDFTLLDNAFIHISDYDVAQQIADNFDPARLHKKLEAYCKRLCPVVQKFRSDVRWSIMQVEYATDFIFSDRKALEALYEPLIQTMVHAVKAEDIASFLGRKLHGNFKDQLGSDFNTRILGTRIKHHMGPASIKMYDKHGLVLRVETTANDVGFFKHRRKVAHLDGTSSKKVAPVLKTIYSLGALRELLGAANRRYSAFLSQLDVPACGLGQLDKISRPVRDKRSHRGFNLFLGDDLDLFIAIARGEHRISGFRNRDLRKFLERNSGQVSRMLKRLRVHGLIKKIAKTYKYYLTKLGRAALACALKLREFTVVPAFVN